MLPLRPRVVGDCEEAAGPRPPPGRQEDEQEIKFQVKDFRIKSSGNSFEWKQEAAGFNVVIENVGNFANESIGFNITLERIIQPYLYQYYFPAIAIVVVSQISFMIPLSASPGRIALVVTQFLTLTNIFIHQIVSIDIIFYSIG